MIPVPASARASAASKASTWRTWAALENAAAMAGVVNSASPTPGTKSARLRVSPELWSSGSPGAVTERPLRCLAAGRGSDVEEHRLALALQDDVELVDRLDRAGSRA